MNAEAQMGSYKEPPIAASDGGGKDNGTKAHVNASFVISARSESTYLSSKNYGAPDSQV